MLVGGLVGGLDGAVLRLRVSKLSIVLVDELEEPAVATCVGYAISRGMSELDLDVLGSAPEPLCSGCDVPRSRNSDLYAPLT